MKERTAAKRYGKALFDLEDEKFAKDILLIREAVKNIPSLIRALSDERIEINRRITVVDAIAQSLNIGVVAANVLKLLIKKSRVRLLDLIVDDFVLRMEHREKLAACHVTVADASVSDETRKKIEEIIGQALKTKARCDIEVSPPIIGGFMLSIGDAKYDASIKGRIERLKEELFKTA